MKIRTKLKFYTDKPSVMIAVGMGKVVRHEYDYLRSYKSNKRKAVIKLEKKLEE